MPDHPLLTALATACPTNANPARLRTILETNLARCDDHAFASAFADKINASLDERSPAGSQRPIPAGAFLQRIIEVDGRSALVGIRFKGMDPTQPFVDLVSWTEREANAPADLAPIARAALDTFKAFNPPRVRVLARSDQPPAISSTWRAVADQHLLAGPLHAVAARPVSTDVRITLADAAVDEAHDFVTAAYRAFHERSPELASRVKPADREELEWCASDGRLAWWLADTQRAGLIAAAPNDSFGLDGFIIIEEVVSPAYLGRGTASLAQHALARDLLDHHDKAAPDADLFGTIDASNAPSLRTAAKAGRSCASTFWFLEPIAAEG